MSVFGGDTASQGEERGGPVGWMADHAKAANVLMALLIIGGVFLSGRIEKRNMPRVVLQKIRVTVPYPGASPEEVEQGVLVPLEAALEGVDEVRRVKSSARQNFASVTASLTTTADTARVLGKVKTAVDGIRAFPSSVEEPQYDVPDTETSVVSVILTGDVTLERLSKQLESLRQKLQREPEIAAVKKSGLPRRQISIELTEASLRKYGMSTDRIARRIREATRQLPGGDIEAHQGKVLLDTSLSEIEPNKLAELPLLSESDGSQLAIGDVAEVYSTFDSPDSLTHYRGERAVVLEVYSDRDSSPVKGLEAVKRVVDAQRAQTQIPVSYDLWDNQAKYYRARIGALVENGLLGFLLVLVVLALFLRPRVGFWTAIGLVTTYLGALCVMPFFGVSLNGVSIFAFLVTLGLVVDDAIVVGDAVEVEQDSADNPVDAAIAGTRKIIRPLVFAVVTSILAFAPTLFVPGPLGQILPDIGAVTATVLVFSLVECLLILPAHLGHPKERSLPSIAQRLRRGQRKIMRSVERFGETVVEPSVRWLMRYRYVTVSAATGSLIIALGILGTGHLKFSFMPQISRTEVKAGIRLSPGATLETTRKLAEQLADGARTANQKSSGDEPLVDRLLVTTGSSGLFEGGGAGSHLAEVEVELAPPSERSVSTKEFSRAWRRALGELPGVENLRFSYETGPATGPDVKFMLLHPETEVLSRAADWLADRLNERSDMAGVESTSKNGPAKLRIRPTAAAQSAGLTASDLARQIRGGFFGSEADRVQKGSEEVRIFVHQPRQMRRSLHALETMTISLPNGGEMSLSRAAKIEWAQAATQIRRDDGRRIARVSGNVVAAGETGANVSSKIKEQVIPELKRQFPDLEVGVSGGERQRRRSLSYLGMAYLVVLFFILGLLMIGLDSYLEPLLVFAVIPFGLVGAIFGHLAMGAHLSMVSLFGIVALTGILINDTVVLLYDANRRLTSQHPIDAIRKRSLQLYDALAESARSRFRPIALTSITTFVGVAPLMLEDEPAVQIMIPLAISLGFGVLFATLVTLTVLPALYLITEDIREVFRAAKSLIGWD